MEKVGKENLHTPENLYSSTERYTIQNYLLKWNIVLIIMYTILEFFIEYYPVKLA